MKKIMTIVLLASLMLTLAACRRQAEVAQYNLRREADDFRVRRRITVLNTRRIL